MRDESQYSVQLRQSDNPKFTAIFNEMLIFTNLFMMEVLMLIILTEQIMMKL